MRVQIRIFTTATAVAVAMVTLAACSSGAGSDSSYTSSPTINIGWLSDQTGAAAIAGIPNLNGAQLAVSQINAQGGVLGKQLKLNVADEACKPQTSVAAARKFLEDSNTFMLVGGSCSEDALAVKTVADKAKVPFLVDSASSPALANPVSPYVYTSNILTNDEANFAAKSSISKFHPKRLGVIYVANDYGQGGATSVESVAKNANIDVVSKVQIPVDTTNYSSYLLPLKESAPDTTVVVVYDVPSFLKQAKQLGIKTNFVFFSSATLRTAVVPMAEAGVLSGITTTFTTPTPMSTTSTSKPMAEFVTAYKAKYNKFPDSADLNGYQSIYIVKTAVEKAGKVDRAKFLTAMDSFDNLDLGLTFPLHYSKTDHSGLSQMSLITYNDNTAPGPDSLFGNGKLFVDAS